MELSDKVSSLRWGSLRNNPAKYEAPLSPSRFLDRNIVFKTGERAAPIPAKSLTFPDKSKAVSRHVLFFQAHAFADLQALLLKTLHGRGEHLFFPFRTVLMQSHCTVLPLRMLSPVRFGCAEYLRFVPGLDALAKSTLSANIATWKETFLRTIFFVRIDLSFYKISPCNKNRKRESFGSIYRH